MSGPIAKYRSTIIFFALFVIGVVLIAASSTFQYDWMKVQLDRLTAEVGALILVVGMLHWFFEFGLRKEMMREVASTAVGSTHMHECGLDTCSLNARDVDERAHWSQAANLNEFSGQYHIHDYFGSDSWTRGIVSSETACFS